jgi:hypothetical protein
MEDAMNATNGRECNENSADAGSQNRDISRRNRLLALADNIDPAYLDALIEEAKRRYAAGEYF